MINEGRCKLCGGLHVTGYCVHLNEIRQQPQEEKEKTRTDWEKSAEKSANVMNQ